MIPNAVIFSSKQEKEAAKCILADFNMGCEVEHTDHVYRVHLSGFRQQQARLAQRGPAAQGHTGQEQAPDGLSGAERGQAQPGPFPAARNVRSDCPLH